MSNFNGFLKSSKMIQFFFCLLDLLWYQIWLYLTGLTVINFENVYKFKLNFHLINLRQMRRNGTI